MKQAFLFLFYFLTGNLISSTSAQTSNSFVTVNGQQFILNNKSIYFTGVNYWYGGLLATGKSKEIGKRRLIAELDFLQTQGISNLRVIAAVEGSGNITGVQRIAPALQTTAGVFDESYLEGLDLLLSEMDKRQMKAVLFLSNNWEWSGGFLQYLQWERLIPDSVFARKLDWDEMRDYTSQFYSCTECIRNYHLQVKKILSHTNTVNGIVYKNDPTIMSWELANEPRPMRPEANRAYFSWIRSTAALIKQADPNHLLCVGHEGVVGTAFDTSLYKEIHALKDIDYLTIHIWPKNWGWINTNAMDSGFAGMMEKVTSYLDTHMQFASELNKPLMLEEFGFPRDVNSFSPTATTHYRDKMFTSLLKVYEQSRKAGKSLAGFNVWAFAGLGRPIKSQLMWKPGDEYIGDPPMEEQGLYSIFDSDSSTWELIRSVQNH
jgi:mannan endo-1,4-beta-mannosidase